MDLGDKRTMEYRITAREIAEDIAREINGDSGEGSYHGVFVAAGDAPSESELAKRAAVSRTGSTWTPDKSITVTRVQVQAKTAPSGLRHQRHRPAHRRHYASEPHHRSRRKRQRRHHAKLCRGCLAHHRRANRRRRLRHEPRRRQRRGAVPHAVVVRLAHAAGLVVSLAAH